MYSIVYVFWISLCFTKGKVVSHIDGDCSIGGQPLSEESLWLHGALAGMKSYPKYGQYIPIDYMKAFLHGLPYMWADKKYYDVEPNMLPFDFIQPFVDEYNKLRCEVSFLLLFLSVA